MTVEDTQPLISHLIELRTRLLRAIISILVIFLCLVWFSNDIYAWVSAPLVERMPHGASMIATEVASPFIAPIKLTLLVSVFLAAPLVLYQVWGFIAPALYRHERRLILPLLISSSALFYLGMVFAYYVVFPLIFGFFTKTAPQGVTIATDINSYLDFVMGLFLAFGLAFEIPVAIILLCWSGVTTADELRKKRPYIIVGVFVVAMLLTPPDVFSQTLLAIPMCLLFELGVFCSRFYVRRDAEGEADDEEANAPH